MTHIHISWLLSMCFAVSRVLNFKYSYCWQWEWFHGNGTEWEQ